jgi:hypothetical protein
MILDPETNEQGQAKCGRIALVGNTANQAGLSFKLALRGISYLEKLKEQE